MKPLSVVTPLGWMLRNKRPDINLSVRHADALTGPRSIVLTSTAFTGGGTIPDAQCSMDLGPNLSPALAWTGVPAGTQQLLFILEDIDVPMSRPALHTIAVIDPAVSSLAEGELKAGPSITFIPAQRGNMRYFGPRPLPGHGVHRYGFHLYALDRALPETVTGIDGVLKEAAGHVLADGFLEGVKKG